MRQFAVIGDPIEHSLSPILHGEIFRQLGIDAKYEKFHVSSNSLDSFMSKNTFDGLNVTLPHKEKIIRYLDNLDTSAYAIGAVNCIFDNIGYNSDWIGFLRAMKINSIELEGKSCLIIGAGGVARSVAYALIMARVASINVRNRSKDREKNLMMWIKEKFPNNTNNPFISYEAIINCTPIGMWPNTESIPSSKKLIENASILVDTIYNPTETQWLKQGKRCGAKTLGGLDMFIAQGLASADIWFQEKISEKIDPVKIRKELELELC